MRKAPYHGSIQMVLCRCWCSPSDGLLRVRAEIVIGAYRLTMAVIEFHCVARVLANTNCDSGNDLTGILGFSAAARCSTSLVRASELSLSRTPLSPASL